MNFHNSVCFVLYVCFIVIVASIDIEDNAYSRITISFSDQVKESEFNFRKLKEVLRKSSENLYHATRKRAYFKEFILIVPSSSSGNVFCTEYVSAPPKKVNIYISNSSLDLRAQNSKGCGQEGEIIYMPAKWTEGNTDELAVQFVQEWSTFRYGVFEENPLAMGTCFFTSDKKWVPVGCYNSSKIETNLTISDDGLPSCEPLDESYLKDLKSSLMFKTNHSKALDFCDVSKEFPHNPVMPTLHNSICEGKTVWSVIESSGDFHGKNFPKELTSPLNPSFKCYRNSETSIQLTFAVQTSSTTDIREVSGELHSSIYRFIKNLIPKNSRLNLVTFADSSDNSKAVRLSTEDDDILRTSLEPIRYTTEKNACLICGIEKALKASQSNPYVSSTVIVIAWESSLAGQEASELVKLIQMHPEVQLHLAFIHDTTTDVVPIDLVEAARTTGRFLHSLPESYRTLKGNKEVVNDVLCQQLDVILSSIAKSPLEVDDKTIVVHAATYKNVSLIDDTFSIPSVTEGKLIYTIRCNQRGYVNRDQNCSLWDGDYLNTFKCGEIVNLSANSPKRWTYKFSSKGVVPSSNLNCSALAILHNFSPSKDYISLRGWLNQYTITPKGNVLIVYAEVSEPYKENKVQVFAEITKPGIDKPTEIELLDNGNGDPDVKSGDGIYSRYVTSYKEKGTYTVTVILKVSETVNSNNGADNVEPLSIQRKVIGSFSITAKLPNIDNLPPNRVADLRVTHIDHENSTVTLQWTAPGNDYDFGKATEYEIKAATHPGNLMDIYFNSEESISIITAPTQQESGENETFAYTFPRNDQESIYYVALRAKDASNNRAKISNIVQVYLNGTIIPETTTGITTTNNESTTDYIITTTNNESTTDYINASSTEDTRGWTVYSTTPDINTTNVGREITWKDVLSDTKFIIILSSAGGILLLLILINIIVCCCIVKRKNKPKKISKKSSLRPPHNLNIAYQHDSQSINQSESDLSVSLNNFASNQYSTSEDDTSPRYAFHTSKSIADKTKSQSNTELGFKLVETMPATATRSLSRFARRMRENGAEEGSNPSIAQPQIPSNSNDTTIINFLGRV